MFVRLGQCVNEHMYVLCGLSIVPPSELQETAKPTPWRWSTGSAWMASGPFCCHIGQVSGWWKCNWNMFQSLQHFEVSNMFECALCVHCCAFTSYTRATLRCFPQKKNNQSAGFRLAISLGMISPFVILERQILRQHQSKQNTCPWVSSFHPDMLEPLFTAPATLDAVQICKQK